MSAICASLRWNGEPVPATRVLTMLRGMEEYGDGAVWWAPESVEQPVALGCIPWRVTPEDAFHAPPVRSADGRVVLVADARIDNRAELAREFDCAADVAARRPDAAFIVAAYERWGRDCPRHLIGDYAFALWDERERVLFCARDAIGQRVLFLHESAQGVDLATTPHALTRLADVPAQLDEQKIADFLVLLPRPENTFYRGIRRLEPGQALTAGRGGLELTRFWSPAPAREVVHASDDDYVAGFLEVFEAAVRAQLRRAGPVGMMASGGLDSSSVAAVAAQQLREQNAPLPTFHAAPRAGFAGRVRRGRVADETPDVEATARMHPNMVLHIRRNDDRSPLLGIEQQFRMTGAPPRNPANAPWFYALYETARDAGIRVLLAGHRGNATISHAGARSIRDSVVRGEWGRVWREIRAVAIANGEGRRSVLRREIIEPLTPAFVSVVAQKLRGDTPPPVWETNWSGIHPDFARRMHAEERVRAAQRDALAMGRMSDRELRLIVLGTGVDGFDLYSGFRPLYGIETRDPTSDRRVVEFCMAIPGSQFLQDGVTRSLVRRAMRGRLPESLRTRTTIGLQSPDWTEWLPTLRGELNAEVEQLQRSDTAQRCLDVARLRALMDEWPSPMTLAHENAYCNLLLRAIVMGRFIRWFERTYN